MAGKITNIGFQKGGVNKTTLAVQLGLYTAEQNKTVLIIDGDAQEDSSRLLGKPDNYDGLCSDSLFTMSPEAFQASWERGERPILPVKNWGCRLPEDVDDIGELMHFVPASAGAMANINESKDKSYVSNFKANVAFLATKYDHLYVDTPPQLGLVQYASLCACTSTVMPLICDFDTCGKDKVTKYFALYNAAKKLHNPQLKLPVVVLSSVDARGKIVKRFIDWARASFKTNLTNKYIEYSTALNNAKDERRAIWFKPVSGNDRTKGAAYRRVITDIYERLV